MFWPDLPSDEILVYLTTSAERVTHKSSAGGSPIPHPPTDSPPPLNSTAKASRSSDAIEFIIANYLIETG